MKNINMKEKYQELKQLLIDGENDMFENEIAQLKFDELVSFYGYIYNQDREAFEKNYYGIKILGELGFILSVRNLVVLDKSFNIGELRKFMLSALQHATKKLCELKYYNDSEKYALTILKYYEISDRDKLTTLSILAECAHFQKDANKELLYCEGMLEIDAQDPRILTNYAYGLMRNKRYDKAKINLEKCLELGYKNFQVYNQLITVFIYGYKDFNKAFSFIEIIFDITDSGNNLNDRNQFLLYNNFLSTIGLSGNVELLPYIKIFKEKIQDKLCDFYILAENYELMNRGIHELNKKNLREAQKYFIEIGNKPLKHIVVDLSIFFKNITLVLQEYEKVKKLEDIESLLKFIQELEVNELFQDYKNIIENYFSLLNGFVLRLEQDIEIVGYSQQKKQVEKFDSSNLTTSEFVYKSFEVIKLIDSYISDYSNSILKNNLKEEYQKKLKTLIGIPFNVNNETTFMYSLNQSNSSTNIDMDLSSLIIRSIELLQKNEPSFIRDYKSQKVTKLLESDFRDIIYRSFGLVYEFTVSAESLSRKGRTDLQVESKKFGTKTFEFKIWGSNDYKDVVKQIYEYLTDFEDVGFIFMINKNRSSIENEYIKNLKQTDMGYIEESLKQETISGFTFLISKHQIHVKTKTIYHFIYNIF